MLYVLLGRNEEARVEHDFDLNLSGGRNPILKTYD